MATAKFKHQQPSDDRLISNLQKLMSEHSVNEAELSRQTNIPQPTLHKILSGKTSDPRISTLKTLSKHFDINIDSLYSDSLLKTSETHQKKELVPILNWQSCIDIAIMNLNDHSKTNNYLEDTSQTSDNKTYALISKPSMEPRFVRNTILIINYTNKPVDGDLVIVHYPNTNEATIRELYIDGPDQKLLPINKDSDGRMLSNDEKILGTLIQSRFNYKSRN